MEAALTSEAGLESNRSPGTESGTDSALSPGESLAVPT